MARRKAVWTGHLAGKPEPATRIGRIRIPCALDQQEGREIMINIPLSRIPSLIDQLQKAYNSGQSLRYWHSEAE